jgi:glyoxylase-like metal-dependent hydrolase (beta-lactamase superfamily II)
MTVLHNRRYSRREFCFCCVTSVTMAATGAAMTPSRVFAHSRGIVESIKDSAASAPITVHHVRGGIAVLEGSGGNVAVLSGRDGKVLVDAGISVSQPQMETVLALLGPEPVTRVINSHWHFDHADGNSWLQRTRPVITAHENTRRHLSRAERVDDWNFDFPPLAEPALPTDVFSTEHSLVMNGTRLDLRYYRPAHTDGDISVLFQSANVLHAGDTFWNGAYPFIDYSTGGSIDGAIGAAAQNLRLGDEHTIIIPGHGAPIGRRPQLARFYRMLVTIRGNVAYLKRKRVSLEAIVAAKPTAEFDAVWGNYVIDPEMFTRLVYHGV